MKRGAIVLLALTLAACGGTATETVTTTETVATTPTSAPAAPALLPADPGLPAECQPQPDQPPACTQGSYQVQPPELGSACDAAGDVWEWNEQYQGLGGGPYTAVCAKRDPAHLPRG